jgi:hypothetical protein
MSERLTAKVLITVMTYPHPLRGYQELVCTAAVSDISERACTSLHGIPYPTFCRAIARKRRAGTVCRSCQTMLMGRLPS